MAFRLVDRVRETTISPGTGTATLSGAALGYQTFSAGVGANNTTYYVIADQSGANWEVGYGTVGAGGTTLARTTVLSSSNAGSLVNFSSGTQDVWVDYPATKAVNLDSSGKLTFGGNGTNYADWASADPTVAAGRMWYNDTTGSWNLGMGNGNITQQVGEELYYYGKASAAITDSPLQIIKQTGVVGASGVITFAPTTSGITDGNLIIGVATESLALNAFGRITTFGVIHGVTTNGTAYGETWADGDTIWYNPVTGNPTKTKPVAPNIKVQIGTVINAGSGGSGSFSVEINHGSVLGGTDSNVQLTSATGGQILTYNQTGAYWANVSLGAGTGFAATAGVGGSLSIGASVAAIGTWMGTPSSANLLAAMTDETGTGSLVFATSPTLVTPILGTPTSGTLTNCTGLPNGGLVNSSVTFNGVSVALGASGTITATATNALTISSPLSGTSYNGSAAVSIGLAAGYGDTQNPYASKTANYFLAAPNGSAGAPTFRAIVAADIPTLNQNTTGTAANVTGIVALANGGSGQTTAQAAMNAFAGAVTSGSYLRGNGTNVVMSTIQAADVPTLNQNTTGTAANVTGTVAIANGGTGATTAAAARTNLGATTVGSNFFTLTNPSAITFPRINADNTVSALDAATFRTAIGAGTGSGTVTSVSGTGSASGLSLSGTVTTSGNITLSGTVNALAAGTYSISISGNAATSTTSVGYGQSWQDVSGSRAAYTTYTNSSGKPILVTVACQDYRDGQNGWGTAYVDGVAVGRSGGYTDGYTKTTSMAFIVQNGSTYRVDPYESGYDIVSLWRELR